MDILSGGEIINNLIDKYMNKNKLSSILKKTI